LDRGGVVVIGGRQVEKRVSLHRALIDVDDSILIVIDVQEHFLAKLPVEEQRLLIKRIGWLIGAAEQLGVPIVATAENVKELGSVAPLIAQRLPSWLPVFNKMVFDLTEDNEILNAIVERGRNTAILVGLETDVCVAHSALGLMRRGFEAVVAADGTRSPGLGHEIGLERVRRAGGLVSSVKSVYYEWVRAVERDREFFERNRDMSPPDGLAL
jgi:nicotinamidase-related amidase